MNLPPNLQFNQLSNFVIKKIQCLSKKVRIALIDGEDERTYQAALLLKPLQNIEITIISETKASSLGAPRIINIHENKSQYQAFLKAYLELRKGKETLAQAQADLKTKPYYTMMLLAQGFFDGVVGGLSYPSADILRAAFKIIGPQKKVKTISSLMLLVKGEETLAFSDISINPQPNLEQLVEIAQNACRFLEDLDYLPIKPAFISFSTQGSAKTEATQLLAQAKSQFNLLNPKYPALGEIQFDAAYDLEIRKLKYRNAEFEEKATLYLVPDLSSGNIAYKVAQRLAHYDALGPIVVGLKKAVNDLSRGSTVNDVVQTTLITALQAAKEF